MIHTYIHVYVYIGYPRLYGTVRKKEGLQFYRIRYDDKSISTEILHRHCSLHTYIHTVQKNHNLFNIHIEYFVDQIEVGVDIYSEVLLPYIHGLLCLDEGADRIGPVSLSISGRMK